jgi:hypothetical protein
MVDERSAGKILLVAPSNVAATHLFLSLLKHGNLRRLEHSDDADATLGVSEAKIGDAAENGLESSAIVETKKARAASTYPPSLIFGDLDKMPEAVHPFHVKTHMAARQVREVQALQYAEIMVSTVSSALNPTRLSVWADTVTQLIVDEAAQLAAFGLLPLIAQLNALKTVILVGDHLQLPATILTARLVETGSGGRDGGYGVSLLECLWRNNCGRYVFLDVNYRMRSAILEWPNRFFYGGRIQQGLADVDTGSVQLYVAQGTEERSEGDTSISNRLEAAVAVALVNMRLITHPGESVCVLTPYVTQRNLLRKLLPAVCVLTVDARQVFFVALKLFHSL